MADFSFLRYLDEDGIYRVERIDDEVVKIYLTPEEIAVEEAEMWLSHPMKEQDNGNITPSAS